MGIYIGGEKIGHSKYNKVNLTEEQIGSISNISSNYSEFFFASISVPVSTNNLICLIDCSDAYIADDISGTNMVSLDASNITYSLFSVEDVKIIYTTSLSGEITYSSPTNTLTIELIQNDNASHPTFEIKNTGEDTKYIYKVYGYLKYNGKYVFLKSQATSENINMPRYCSYRDTNLNEPSDVSLDIPLNFSQVVQYNQVINSSEQINSGDYFSTTSSPTFENYEVYIPCYFIGGASTVKSGTSFVVNSITLYNGIFTTTRGIFDRYQQREEIRYV